MAKENHTKYALLGLLTTECRTGYAIKQIIDQSLTHFWKISYGQIYPNLKKLVEEGLATVTNTSQDGKPDKKEYAITEAGLLTLQQWLQQPLHDIPTEKNELLLKLFFSRHQDSQTAIEQVKQYKEKLQERLNIYSGIKKHIEEHEKEASDAVYWFITLDYGIRTTQATSEWCEETIKTLQNK